MKTFIEKRTSKRCVYNVPIEFSPFHLGGWFKALSINHSENGMCIKSNNGFKPGTTLIVRTKNYPSKVSCPCCADEGLRTITLGQIEWCREVPERIFSSNEIGVRYHLSGY